MNEPTKEDKIRLQSYFGFSKIPFTKYMWAKHMFRSRTQTELLQGLNLFLEYKGICLVSGPPGVGKSISLRRLREERLRRVHQPRQQEARPRPSEADPDPLRTAHPPRGPPFPVQLSFDFAARKRAPRRGPLEQAH